MYSKARGSHLLLGRFLKTSKKLWWCIFFSVFYIIFTLWWHVWRQRSGCEFILSISCWFLQPRIIEMGSAHWIGCLFSQNFVFLSFPLHLLDFRTGFQNMLQTDLSADSTSKNNFFLLLKNHNWLAQCFHNLSLMCTKLKIVAFILSFPVNGL